MVNIKTQIRNNWHKVFVLSILFGFIIVSLVIYREVIVFNNETESFRNDLLNIENIKIEKNVNNRILEIEAMYVNAEEDMRTHIKENISGLDFAISSVLEEMDTASLTEKQEAVIRITQEYNILDEKHLYFIIDLDGFYILSGITNEVMNENHYDDTDFLGRYFVREMINESTSSLTKDSYITYYYPKEVGGEALQKTSYVKQVSEVGYIIGSGVYLEQYSDFLLEEIQESFAEYYSQNDEYVYILSGDGEVVFHVNDDLVGQFKDDITDPVWSSALSRIYDFVEDGSSGLFDYEFYSNSISGEISSKTAYIKYLPDRDIIVGASYTNDLHDDLIDEYVTESYHKALILYGPVFLLLILIVILIFHYVSVNINKSQRLFNEEEELYRKFSNLTNEMIIITETDGQIVFINKIGERLIGTRQSDPNAPNLNRILGDEDGFSILRGTESNYYVKYKREQIMYNAKECDLYFITDVTDKVNTEKALENLVLLDELTGLGNRRKMIKDFKDDITPYVQKTGLNAFLVMLDVDDFKNVNDKHGHIFGDQVLKKIAEFLNNLAEENTVAYRVGGDEFTVLIKNKTEKEAFKMFQSLNKKIQKFKWDKPIAISFSGGLATINAKDEQRRLNDYVDIADKKLYNAKLSGKMKIH